MLRFSSGVLAGLKLVKMLQKRCCRSDGAEAMVQVQVLVLQKQMLQQRIALIRSGFSRR